MRDETPPVAAIVLTHNNFGDTDECLRSLAASAYPALSLIVVDNGSTDGSFELLEDAWGKTARLLRSEKNLGVPGGYNVGIREALAAGARYVILLNNDIVVDKRLVEALLPAFEAEPRLGIVAPIITYYERRERLWFAGAVYNRLLGISRHELLSRPLSAASGLMGRLFASDYVPNCCAMIPAAVFREIGLLHEGFFVGLDDIDWCLRLREAGYEVRVAGQPLVAHKVSATVGERGSNVLTSAQAYHYARSSMLLGARWRRGWRLPLYLAGQVLIRFPYYSLQMALRGRPDGIASYARGIAHGLREFVFGGPPEPPPPA
jgi:GT2 family glycosyltransferase